MPKTLTSTATTWASSVIVPQDGDDATATAAGNGEADIEEVVQTLLDREQFLFASLPNGLLLAPVSLSSTGGTTVTLGRVDGIVLGGRLWTASAPTLDSFTLVANAWRYVYAYVKSTGSPAVLSLAFEVSATGPAADSGSGGVWKTGDATRRYLGCFRTDGSANVVPFRKVGREVLYGWSYGATDVFGLGSTQMTSTTWASVIGTVLIPPQARRITVRVLAELLSGSAALVSVRAYGGTNPPANLPSMWAWAVSTASPVHTETFAIDTHDGADTTTSTLEFLTSTGAALTLHAVGFTDVG